MGELPALPPTPGAPTADVIGARSPGFEERLHAAEHGTFTQQAAVETHLARCPDCRRRERIAARCIQTLPREPLPSPPQAWQDRASALLTESTGDPKAHCRKRGRALEYVARRVYIATPSALRGADHNDPLIPASAAPTALLGDLKAVLRMLQFHGADKMDAAQGAEDFAQRALLELISKTEQLPPRSQAEWRRWFVRRALDFLARARGQTRTAIELQLEELAFNGPDPCNEAMRAEEAGRFESVLEKLSAEQRAMVRLTVMEKVSIAEAAKKLGTSHRTARRRRNRILQHLRELLQRQGGY